MTKGCKTCACGCGARYAKYYRDGNYFMNSTHYKNMRAKEKGKKETQNQGGN